MTAAPPFSIALVVLVFLALLPVLMGLLLLARARRRVGATPHCRRCDYDLTANASAVCPECGADLTPANVVAGDRRRAPAALALGLFLLVVPLIGAGAFLVTAVRAYDWYRLRPTGWVIDDLQSKPSATDVKRAWTELQRRRDASALSPAHDARLTQLAFAEQANAVRETSPRPPSPVLQELMDYLGDRCLAGALTPDQVKQFCETGCRVQIRLRALVVEGDAFPVETSVTGVGPSQGWWMRHADEGTTIDGKVEPNSGGGYGTTTGFGGGGSSTHHFPGRPAGDHTLATRHTLEVFLGQDHDENTSRPIHKWQSTTSHTFRVEPRSTPVLKLIDKPDLAPAIARSAAVTKLAIRARPDGRPADVQLAIDLRSPPENVAFDIFARSIDAEHPYREYPCGSVYVAKGKSTTWYTDASSLRDVPFDRVEIILRSSESTARGTIDLFEIWKGDVTLPAVRITRTTK